MVIETTGQRSEAQARECADVVMQAGKLMSKPDRKLVEYKSFYRFGFMSMGLMIVLTLCTILLWGGNARQKKKLINGKQHLVLEAAHPSPLSAYNGFFGCGHFNKANEFLKSAGKIPVDWQI